MSLNFNMSDDAYDGKSKHPFNNSQLNFGTMPSEQSYNPSVSSNFQDPSSFYSMPNQQANNYYPDWSQQQQQQFFIPQLPGDKSDPFSSVPNAVNPNSTDFDNEPPLLEELGINFSHIFMKTKCVLNPVSKPHESIIHDEDLAGPLVFCIAYGFSLLLVGKMQFGYIYGITALGCLGMYSLLNLMSEQGVSAMCIGSVLGYCLLPMVILSFISSLIKLTGFISLFVSLFFIFWCSISSSKLFVSALNMNNQQLLVLYPCFLLYGIFALLNVF